MAAPRLGLTGYIIAAQGIFGIVNGSVSLLSISAARSNADMLGIPSIAGVHAIALGSLSIGAFYINAALNHDENIRPFLLLGRVLGAVIFWSHGGKWRQVAVFECVCAALMKLGMVWEEFWATRERSRG